MRYLEVIGRGSVTRAADLIEINLSLVAKQSDYAATLARGADQLQDLQQALQELGLSEETIRTKHFSIHTKYEPAPDTTHYQLVFDGYELRHNLNMTFSHDDTKLNQLLNRLGGLKDKPEFHLSFKAKEAAAAEQLALERALADAAQQALDIARLSGLSLGEIQSITPHTSSGAPYAVAFKDKSFDYSFPAGDTTFTRELIVRYAIE